MVWTHQEDKGKETKRTPKGQMERRKEWCGRGYDWRYVEEERIDEDGVANTQTQ